MLCLVEGATEIGVVTAAAAAVVVVWVGRERRGWMLVRRGAYRDREVIRGFGAATLSNGLLTCTGVNNINLMIIIVLNFDLHLMTVQSTTQILAS